ncbi:MAG: hypothetical protein CBE24_01550 [bacterium TMED264]|nr:MAG: hypothetical protein CBE24_01550 [bacterium TMED264]
MIRAFLLRRLWLWKNRLIPSIFLFLFMPIILFIMISIPLKNIIRFSISGVPYDIWVFPGLIFIIGSLGLYPIIYREIFDLRVHRKVLLNIALAPFSKSQLVFGNLCISVLEALTMCLFSIFIYFSIVSIPLNTINLLFLMFCLVIYLFLIGNIYILLSISIDAITTMILSSFIFIIFIIFGNGFLIEFSFFPSFIESVLKYNPISFSQQCYQRFVSTGYFDWTFISIQIILIYILFLLNGFLLKRKLRQ